MGIKDSKQSDLTHKSLELQQASETLYGALVAADSLNWKFESRKDEVFKKGLIFYAKSMFLVGLMFIVLAPHVILGLSTKGLFLLCILQAIYCILLTKSYQNSLFKNSVIKPSTRFIWYAGLVLVGMKVLGLPSFLLGMFFSFYLLIAVIVYLIQSLVGVFQ